MASEGMGIRDARPDEADAVAALHETSATIAFSHIFPPDSPYPREDTLHRWRTFTGRILVAEATEESTLAGFVAFDHRELHALYVAPTWWGNGIGARLLAAAGPVKELWVLRDNMRGRRFWESHGWRPDGTEREAYGIIELRYRRDSDQQATPG